MAYIHSQKGTGVFRLGDGLCMKRCCIGWKIITVCGSYEVGRYRSEEDAQKILWECVRRVRNGDDYFMPQDKVMHDEEEK